MRPLFLLLIGGLLCTLDAPRAKEKDATETAAAGVITGVVVDSLSGLPLADVNARLIDTELGARTGAEGRFRILYCPPGDYRLRLSFVGYEDLSIHPLTLGESETLDLDLIRLSEKVYELNTVVVTPGSYSLMGPENVSRQTLSGKQIKSMTYAEDLTRAVTRLPGVSSNDYSSKFTVRGGEANEVLMELDGMELYEPFHQRDFAGGLFSIIDIESIEGVDLHTGGFSAEYGNRQSAVFSLKTRDPEPGTRRTSLALSAMIARLYTEGGFAGGRGGYLFSARRGLLDKLFKLVGYVENVPKFQDALAKLRYELSPRHVLSLHGLYSGDLTEVRDITEEAHDIHDTRYRNLYSWLTLRSFHNPRLISRTILTTGAVHHDRNGDAEKYEYSDKLHFKLKDVRDYTFAGIKQDWDWRATDRLALKLGFDLRRLKADYDYSYTLKDVRVNDQDSLVNYEREVDIRTRPSGHQLSAYLSGRLSVTPRLFLETGLRGDRMSYSGDSRLSPRAGFAYALSPATFLRGAWGYYYQSQFINDLDVNHNGTSFSPAELSRHYVLGLEHQFASGLSLRLDGYQKEVSNISPFYENLRDPWEVFPETRNDVVRVDINRARATGLELFLKYDVGRKFSWWFSYALARARDEVREIQFDGMLDERLGTLPRLNNQLHTVYYDFNYRPNARWHFNLSWQYFIGWPVTKYQYRFQVLPNDSLHFYPAHTRFRGDSYPPYHRMDLRINRHFQFERSRLSAFLHVINFYNRENVRKFDLDVRDGDEQLMPDGQGGYNYLSDITTWLGIMPVIGLTYDF